MRDVLIIGIACAAAILVGAWLYFSDTGIAPTAQDVTASFTVLDQGNDSGTVTERKNYRIKNQDELALLWKMVHGTGAPTGIDFTKDEVIAVFDGTHPTGGYGISIASVVDTKGGIRTVAIRHTEPGESCATTDAITSPFEIVVIAKSGFPLSHSDEVAVIDCK